MLLSRSRSKAHRATQGRNERPRPEALTLGWKRCSGGWALPRQCATTRSLQLSFEVLRLVVPEFHVRSAGSTACSRIVNHSMKGFKHPTPDLEGPLHCSFLWAPLPLLEEPDAQKAPRRPNLPYANSGFWHGGSCWQLQWSVVAVGNVRTPRRPYRGSCGSSSDGFSSSLRRWWGPWRLSQGRRSAVIRRTTGGPR